MARERARGMRRTVPTVTAISRDCVACPARERPDALALVLCALSDDRRVPGSPDRHLRLRLRWPHRRPVRHRPAAARVDRLRRRHRPPALRPQADRRGPRIRPRVPRPPRRAGREGPGHRVQLRERRDAARRPGALRRARGRGDLSRPPAARSPPAGPAGSA